MRDIAVIGAGPAGLAAAWRLSEAGANVTLYERRGIAGGMLRTDTLEGARGDVAVQLLGSYYNETLRLAGEVGGAGLLLPSPGRDALWRDGRAHPISYGSVASMVVSSALPPSLKFRLASRYLPFLRRHAGVLDPGEPSRAVALDEESIATWGRRELGSDFVELLVYPQLAAYYGSTPEETSAAYYHALARAALDLRLYAVRGGMGELAAAILSALEQRGAAWRGNIEVQRVRGEETGVNVEWDGGGARHDGAILAVPAPVALHLADPEPPLRDWLAKVRTAGSAALALVVERPLPVDYFGLSCPRTTAPGERVAALCVQAQKGAEFDGERREIIVAYPAPTLLPRLATASPREALDLLLPAVEQLLPGIRGRIAHARSYRYPSSGTLFYPGYLRHLARFDPGWLPPRLQLAGDYLVAPTVEGAVRSGRRAAERLLANRG